MVDFNRCGTPLVEIVTEPDVRSRPQASEWLRLLRVTLRQLGVSDVNMEEGSLRCDANVSMRPVGSDELGTKTELKNMNSFRFLERGIEAEIARQIALVEDGGKVTQETLHFDPRTGALSSLRSKEEAHDYRYFPEPDLVAIAPTEAMLERARAALPELPGGARAAAGGRAGPPAGHGAAAGLPRRAGRLLRAGPGRRRLAPEGRGQLGHRRAGRLSSATRDPGRTKVEPAALAQLVALVEGGDVAASAAKEVLGVLIEEGGDPAAIVEERGLGKAGGDELGAIVDQVLADNPDVVDKVKGGNPKAIGRPDRRR